MTIRDFFGLSLRDQLLVLGAWAAFWLVTGLYLAFGTWGPIFTDSTTEEVLTVILGPPLSLAAYWGAQEYMSSKLGQHISSYSSARRVSLGVAVLASLGLIYFGLFEAGTWLVHRF